MNPEHWLYLKRLGPSRYSAPKVKPRMGSILAAFNPFRKRVISKRHVRRATIPTQHERVIMGRAARMGITVAEYKARFC